tara:strand:+ start:4096 stop:4287 length:192 start_codon:yes stop_codon:yes gene_type:complete
MVRKKLNGLGMVLSTMEDLGYRQNFLTDFVKRHDPYLHPGEGDFSLVDDVVNLLVDYLLFDEA